MVMVEIIAALFGVGRVPGWPVQIGQMFVFGVCSSGLFKQAQNILLLVLSSICTSIPIIGVYVAIKKSDKYSRIVSCTPIFEKPHMYEAFRFVKTKNA